MKFKSFMTMTMVAMAFVLSVCSCSSDDDDPVVALADQVAKEYSGKEVVMVMGEESSNDTKTYSFAKASESSINMTIPEMGMGGHMSIPALQVKNIGGALASYTGSVTNADGSEKAFTITGLAVLVNGKNIVVTYSLKYGNMPMLMVTTFTGTEK